MTAVVFVLVAGLLFPWAPLEKEEASQEFFAFLEQGRWEEAEEGLSRLVSREPSARWMYLRGRLEESRARWWDAWFWYGWSVAYDEDPWSTLAASRWVRLEFRLSSAEATEAAVWAIFPIEPLGGTPREAAVARALTHYLVRHLSATRRLRPLGPRQLMSLKTGPQRYRGSLPPAHTPAGSAARLSILPEPGAPGQPYLDPSRTDDADALRGALTRFQTDAGLTTTGKPDGPTAVALERALTSWMARETILWTPEETSRAADEAAALRILQGSLQELPEGGFRWSLTLLDRASGAVVAGPHEGWLTDGRFYLEWDAALRTLGVTLEGAEPGLGTPWGTDLPEKGAEWEAWGTALEAEDGQDPVESARAYSLPAERYGTKGWGREIRFRAKGWNLPLAQIGVREEKLLRELARGQRDLDDAVRWSRMRMTDGMIPGGRLISPEILSAPQILGSDGRLILEGQIP